MVQSYFGYKSDPKNTPLRKIKLPLPVGDRDNNGGDDDDDGNNIMLSSFRFRYYADNIKIIQLKILIMNVSVSSTKMVEVMLR